MCGISGLIGCENKNALKKMLKEIDYRGPDFTSKYFSQNFLMGTNVLRITGKKGDQPITNEEGDVIAVFNGEIYNHKALREKLEKKGHEFKTDADTEIIVHAYEEWGENFSKNLDGMFAIALRDEKEKKLILTRDRFGIKPLYYYKDKTAFIFASEIKSLLASGLVKPEINIQALNEFLTMRLTSDSKTLIKNVFRVKPAHTITLKENKLSLKKYWHKSPVQGCLKEMIKESIRKRTPQDRETGVFLSGGLDSTIIAYYSKQFNEKIKTFSISYGKKEDESAHAKKIAQILGTEHYEVTFPPKVFEKFPELVYLSDEPVFDPVIIPSFVLSSALKKQGIRVVLSGEGADEVFGGYSRYRDARMLYHYHKLRFKPSKLLGQMRTGKNVFVKRLINSLTGDFSNAFIQRNAVFTDSEKKKILKKKCFTKTDKYFARQVNNVKDVFSYEVNHFLPKFILTKVDRMGMANHVESRTPFLSHDIVSFGMSLPINQKSGWINSKKILRDAFKKELPRTVVNRKKKPFWTPTTQWMNEEMKHWVDHYFSQQKNKEIGLFDYDELTRIRIKSAENYYYNLKTWVVLTLQTWIDFVKKKWE
ncbi:MAG: asparagine synthase (glutamine-hydrolyzing) [Nanoarchaeota archaeon]|nr:asparagine synthase (glutamine-hydrolyzing) [Nanoarchaeota archaeon]